MLAFWVKPNMFLNVSESCFALLLGTSKNQSYVAYTVTFIILSSFDRVLQCFLYVVNHALVAFLKAKCGSYVSS